MRAYYELNGVCGRDGEYLLGAHAWPAGVRVRRALARCYGGVGAGWSEPTRLGMEVGGVMIGVELALVGGGPGEMVEVSLRVAGVDEAGGVAVGAGSEVRWKRVSGPAAIEDGVSEIGLVMEVEPLGEGSTALSGLTLRWVEGAGHEAVTLYHWQPGTNTFAEASPGIASGRVTLTSGSDFSLRIQGELTLAADGAEGLVVSGTGAEVREDAALTGASYPRVEFFRGVERVGSVSKSGELRVGSVAEVTSGNLSAVSAGTDRFRFYAGGALKGILGGPGVGLRVAGLKEE